MFELKGLQSFPGVSTGDQLHSYADDRTGERSVTISYELMHHVSPCEMNGCRKSCRTRLPLAISGRRALAVISVMAIACLPFTATARTWHVPEDAPTIQAGIDSAGVGDDVLVAPGVYREHEIGMKAGVWIHSEQGPAATTIDAESAGRGLVCLGAQQAAILEGFEIRHGRGEWEVGNGSGGGVWCVDSQLLIRNCVISACIALNEGGGLCIYNSDVDVEACRVEACSAGYGGGGIYTWCWPGQVRITDCEIEGNEAGSGGGGIAALAEQLAVVTSVVSWNVAAWGAAGGVGCYSPELVIQDCLVTHNSNFVYGGGALAVDTSSGMISGCTVANNVGVPSPPCGISLISSDITVERTIIANHGGRGLGCSNSNVTVLCCDLYANTDGDDLCGTDLGGNFSADPLFCDAENGDYTLDVCSPCLPGNHPDGVGCGLIGALGQGCGATAVEETSWGRIKGLYWR